MTFGYFCSNAALSSLIAVARAAARLGRDDAQRDRPEALEPARLDVRLRRRLLVDAAGFFCPGVPPQAATTSAATTSATALSHRVLICALPLPVQAARQRRLESIPVGPVDRAPHVHHPAVLAHGDRRREQDGGPGLEPEQLRLAALRGPRLDLVVGVRGRVAMALERVVQRGGVKSRSVASGTRRSGTRLWSSEIGMPSSIRRRWRSSSSAPGAIWKASASSIVAGRTARTSTRAVRSGRASGRAPTGSSARWEAPRAPLPPRTTPGPRVSTSPSATSSSSARRTVARLTPSSSHSQRSEGSRCRGVNPPPSISSAICR